MAEANEAITSAVPVLFTNETIVLPGMVVPIELDDAARAAVDAAQATESGGQADGRRRGHHRAGAGACGG